jgi:hypothetical protein
MTVRMITFAVLALSAFPGLAQAADVTCRRYGHRTSCDDGTTFRHHGNRIVDDEGNVWRRRDNGDGDP